MSELPKCDLNATKFRLITLSAIVCDIITAMAENMLPHFVLLSITEPLQRWTLMIHYLDSDEAAVLCGEDTKKYGTAMRILKAIRNRVNHGRMYAEDASSFYEQFVLLVAFIECVPESTFTQYKRPVINKAIGLAESKMCKMLESCGLHSMIQKRQRCTIENVPIVEPDNSPVEIEDVLIKDTVVEMVAEPSDDSHTFLLSELKQKFTKFLKGTSITVMEGTQSGNTGVVKKYNGSNTHVTFKFGTRAIPNRHKVSISNNDFVNLKERMENSTK